MEIICTVAGWPCSGEGAGWGGREKIYGESASPFQPCLHPNLLDPAPCVSEPRRELRQIHATVIGQVLLLGFGWVGIGLVFFYPFHKHCSVPHSAHWVLLLGKFAGRFFVKELVSLTHSSWTPAREL